MFQSMNLTVQEIDVLMKALMIMIVVAILATRHTGRE